MCKDISHLCQSIAEAMHNDKAYCLSTLALAITPNLTHLLITYTPRDA